MSINAENLPSSLLLDVYKKAITERMYEEMLEQVKPKLREAAIAAVADLRGVIEQHFDRYANEAVLRISLEIDGKEKAKR